MRLRRLSAGTLALAACLAGTTAVAAPGWSREWIEAELSQAVGGTVAVGALRFDPLRLRLDVEDVRVEIPGPEGEPLRGSIASGRFQLAWSGVAGLAAGRIRITELVLDRPDVFVDAAFFGRRPEPPPRKRAFEWQVGRVEIRNGRFRFRREANRLALDVDKVSVTGAWDAYRKTLAGVARGAVVLEHPTFAGPYVADLRAGFRFAARRLELFRVVAEAPGLHAEGAANLAFAGGFDLSGSATVRAALTDLGRHLRSGFPPIRGTLDGNVRFAAGGSPARVQGEARVRDAAIGPLAVDEGLADLAIRGGMIELRRLSARAFGGNLTGSVDVSLRAPTRFRADVRGEGVEVRRLVALAGLTLPLAARGPVAVVLEGEAAHLATWTGRGTMEAVARGAGPGEIEASASGSILFETGRLRLDVPEATLASTRIALGLDLDLSRSPLGGSLSIRGTSDDAGETRDGTARILESLGIPVPGILRDDLAGSGTIATRIAIAAPLEMDLEMALRDGRFAREPFDAASLAFTLRGDRLDIARLEATGGGQSIAATARLDVGANRWLALDARASGLEAASLIDRFDVPVRLSGKLAGSLRAERDPQGVLRGNGEVRLQAATVEGESVDRAAARMELVEDVLTLSDLTIDGPAIDAAGEVRIDLAAKAADIALQRATVDLSRLELLRAAAIEAEGCLDLAGTTRFVVGRGPAGTLTVAGSSLALLHAGLGLDRVEMGRLAGEAVLSEDGLRAGARGIDATAWSFDGTLGWSRRAPFRGHLRFGDLGAAWKGSLPQPLALTLAGEVRAEGDLVEPAGMRLDGTLERLKVRIGARDVATVAVLPLRLAGGKIELGPAVLQGPAVPTRLEARLGYDRNTNAIDATLRGSVDLSATSILWPDLRATGILESDVTVAGTLREPDLRGRMSVREATFRILGFPQVFEQVEAEFVHEGRRVRIENLRALSGGGEISGGGDVELEGLTPASIDATVELTRVQVRYPEGFRGVYDGGLFLHRSGSTITLGGRVEMVEGQYAKDFEMLGLFAAAGRRWTPVGETTAPKSVLLDVDLVSEGNVWLRNNVGKVEGRLDFHLGGTLAKPELTGRVGLFEGGTVRFQDVDYRIVSGSVDLVDRSRIAPYLDLRGETKVRNYEIFLQIRGTVDRFEYELTSNPPLPEQDIIGLLLTGSTLESINTATGGGAGTLTGDVATNYFAGLLSARLTKQVRQALGLDRFEINPLLAQGQTDPTARVTVGKEVTRGLRVLYSYDIGSNERHLYQLEWEASRRFRFNAERDPSGDVGGDLFYTDRYDVGRREAPLPGTPPATAFPGPPIAAVTITGADPREEPVLVRAVPFAVGSAYSRPRLFEGADAIRRLYVTSGRIEARVRAEARADADGMRILYRVEAGPWVRVLVEGVRAKDRRRILRKLNALWAESGGTSDLYGVGEDLVRADLQSRGYFASDVRWDALDGDETRVVRYRIEPGKPVKIGAIRFAGAREIPPETLRGLMLTRTKKALKRGVLDPAVLDEDIEVIQRYYDAEGFPRAVVRPPLIRLSVKGDAAEILIPVVEGPRFRFGSVSVPRDLPFTSDDLLAWAAIHPGDPFSRATLAEAEGRLRGRFDAAGYPDVQVDSEVTLGESNADVAFRVTAGAFMRVGAIEIAGNDRTRDKIIRRDLAFALGEPLSAGKLLETQHRLYRLGLFNSVRIENLAMEGGEAADRKVRVKVVEGPPIGFSLGLGYSTEAGARATFSVSDDNVGGNDRRVAFQGRVSGIEQRLQLVVEEQRLFNRPVGSLLAFITERDEQVSFTIHRRSAALRVDWKPDNLWKQFARYNYQRIRISDIFCPAPSPGVPCAGEEELLRQKLIAGDLGDVGYSALRDSRDDPFQPTQGGYAGVELRLFAKPFLSDSTFAKAYLQGSANKPLGRGTGYAAALRLGVSSPFAGTARVPLSERFFGGGETTLRGFPRDTVGPGFDLATATFCQPAGIGNCQPIGGEALLLLNQEFTFPIWSALRGVLFLDAGNVWLTPEEVDLSEIRSSLGLGIRVLTPIGPIRFEYGHKLDRQTGESRGEYLIGIGSWF